MQRRVCGGIRLSSRSARGVPRVRSVGEGRRSPVTRPGAIVKDPVSVEDRCPCGLITARSARSAGAAGRRPPCAGAVFRGQAAGRLSRPPGPRGRQGGFPGRWASGRLSRPPSGVRPGGRGGVSRGRGRSGSRPRGGEPRSRSGGVEPLQGEAGAPGLPGPLAQRQDLQLAPGVAAVGRVERGPPRLGRRRRARQVGVGLEALGAPVRPSSPPCARRSRRPAG